MLVCFLCGNSILKLEILMSVLLLPIRCFCELSAQIGFSEKATDVFQMNNVFGIYRSVVSVFLCLSNCNSDDHCDDYASASLSLCRLNINNYDHCGSYTSTS